MSKTSLSSRLLEYLRKWWELNPNKFIHKGEIEQLAKDAGYLAETINRQMRILVQEGKIEKKQKGISQELRWVPDIQSIADNINKLV